MVALRLTILGAQIKGLWHPIRGYLGVTGYDMYNDSEELFNFDTFAFGPGDSVPNTVKNVNYDLEITFSHQSTYYGDLWIVVKGIAHLAYYDELRVIRNEYRPPIRDAKPSGKADDNTTSEPF